MTATFRPLPSWPHPSTPNWERRSRLTFKAGWADTLSRLEYEIGWLDGYDIIIGAGLALDDIRLDGYPRANAREPIHPGVEASFQSRHGRLVYATDVCAWWQHNVRSIALGLEALRAVDRYGITATGQQYAGFAQLTAGGPDADRGRQLVEKAGSVTEALRRAHPDTGGNVRDFMDVQAYRALVKS